MCSTTSWEHFKIINIHPTRSENTDIYVLKENENVIHFEIRCSIRDMHSSGSIFMRSKIIEKGTINYDQINNRFNCIFESYENPYLSYNTKDVMKSVITELFLNKFNSESSIEMTFPKC